MPAPWGDLSSLGGRRSVGSTKGVPCECDRACLA